MDKNSKKTPLHGLEQDAPALAARVRCGMDSRHVLHKNDDIRKILDRVRLRLEKRVDS
jgi:hypothetical protein